MSKYKKIATEFRNTESLLRALKDLKVEYEAAPDPRQPSLALYGFQGDKREERASFVIRREFINKTWSGFFMGDKTWHNGYSNDLGFAWDGQGYQLQISQYDSSRPGELAALDQLRQRYAFHEVHRQARAKGYTVRESSSENGAINLILVKR
jgi:hypothetical protein